MKGTMKESARGAKEVDKVTIGIGPTGDKADMNEYIDYPLLTNMHAGRNFMNIISADVLIFVSVASPGTLSELAHAIQMSKPSIVIRGSATLQAFIKELDATKVIFVDSLEELEKYLGEFLND